MFRMFIDKGQLTFAAHFNDDIHVAKNRLAPQAADKSDIVSLPKDVIFLILHFFEAIQSLDDVDMACAAPTIATTGIAHRHASIFGCISSIFGCSVRLRQCHPLGSGRPAGRAQLQYGYMYGPEFPALTGCWLI